MKRHMKALAALAGIKDNLCYHQARHSFASLITLEAGVPIETISRMLGHSDISTTQVYARVSPKKLFEDMDKFIEANQGFSISSLTLLYINDMRSTFSLLPYINRSRVKADGTTGILCRITIDGSRPPSVRNLLPPRRLEMAGRTR